MKMANVVVGGVFTLVTVVALAQAPAAGAKTVAQEADEIFAQRCNVCHGDKGDGNGPGAAALNPKPRNWTDAKWQASVDDAKIAKVIVEGGPSIGLNILMSPNPDLKGKDALITEIVKRVRAFKGKK